MVLGGVRSGGGGAKLEDRSVFAELIKEALATN